jgi:hypothetical protein
MTLPELLDMLPPSASVTIRVAAPDGTVRVFAWQDGDIVSTGYDAAGRVVSRSTVALSRNGDVHVDEDVPPEWRVCPSRTPGACGSATEGRGSDAIHIDVADGVRVDKTYDDRGQLTAVHLTGPWGEERLTLRPGGGSTCSWRLSGLHGHESWDGGHHCVDYEVAFDDRDGG